MLHALILAAVANWSLTLNGPWKFHTGDDVRWAAPAFDDRSWTAQSLAAPASANDGDQGITHFAPGWEAQGYGGYTGFAWYRIHVENPSSGTGVLAILGPAMADSAYQIYVNGQLVGGIGDFSSATPVAYGVHPAIYAIPATNGPLVIAVRAWMAPFAAGPRSGGMHVAPLIGTPAGVSQAYHEQWFEKIRAFALEIAQVCIFVALALWAFLRRSPALAIALLLTAAIRANLIILWCLNVMSVPAYFIIQGFIVVPLALGAWMVAWTSWLELQERWLAYVALAMTALYVVLKVAHAAPLEINVIRYAFLVLLVLIVYLGLRERRTRTLIALPAIVLIAIGQFAPEVARLGVPGIWFPFGMGVSLTNYAYLLASCAIALLLNWPHEIVKTWPFRSATSRG
jgi:hypothetical protein